MQSALMNQSGGSGGKSKHRRAPPWRSLCGSYSSSPAEARDPLIVFDDHNHTLAQTAPADDHGVWQDQKLSHHASRHLVALNSDQGSRLLPCSAVPLPPGYSPTINMCDMQDDFITSKLQPWVEKTTIETVQRMANALPLLEKTQWQLQECLAKQHKLEEEVEEVKRQQSVCETGSYEEGAPAPPMLRTSVIAVENALRTCAWKLVAEVKKQMLKDLQESRRLESLKNAEAGTGGACLPSYIDFQRQLCESFFKNFESLSFEDHPVGVFEKPCDLKRRLFKEFCQYSKMDGIDEQKLFLDQKKPFQGFLNSKMDLFVKDHGPAPFANADQREFCLRSILQMAPHPSSLFLDFAALAKEVWLLHKLAFSFQPTAEIFRVTSGSQYDPDFMRDMEPDHHEEDAGRAPAAQVQFMAVPGFTLRNLTFHARVYLKKHLNVPKSEGK